MLLCIFLAGAVGGAVNALMTDNGFLLPQKASLDDSTSVLRPGFIGNMFIGAVAAVVSWGLYGPLSAVAIVGTQQAPAAGTTLDQIGLSLASLTGAVLIGVGGARWLPSEVDKSLLRATAAQAAGAQPSPAASQQIAMASPAQALNVAKSMSGVDTRTNPLLQRSRARGPPGQGGDAMTKRWRRISPKCPKKDRYQARRTAPKTRAGKWPGKTDNICLRRQTWLRKTMTRNSD